MWLFTKQGFFSIVRKEDVVHVRSRSKRDLENLIKTAPPGQFTIVKSYAGSDYPWRIITDQAGLLWLATALVEQVDYANFKGEIARRPDQAGKLPALHQIWHLMREQQDSSDS